MPVSKRLYDRLRLALEVSYEILKRAEALQWQTAYALRHSQAAPSVQWQDEEERLRALKMDAQEAGASDTDDASDAASDADTQHLG